MFRPRVSSLGGICGAVNSGLVSECSNSGYIKSESLLCVGISGGIAGLCDSNGKVEKCYNTGKIATGNYSAGTTEKTGGIVGMLGGSVSVEYCYSSGEFENEEAVGEIIGWWKTSSGASVSNCYYTNTSLNGIGLKDTVKQEDQTGITEKVSKIGNFDSFKKWMINKHSSLIFES